MNYSSLQRALIFTVALPLVLLFSSSCGSTKLSTTSETAREYYRQGHSLEKHMNWGKAADAYKHAVREDRFFFEAYAGLARIYEEQGNFRRAAENYSKALAIQKNRTDFYLPYGKMLFNLERYAEAYDVLQKYHLAFPDDPDGVEWLAEAAWAMHDPSAEKYFTQLAVMDSADIDAQRSLAHYYYEEKQFAKAIPVYDRVFKLSKVSDANAYFEFGDCLSRMKLWSLAKDQFEKSVELNAKNRLAKEYLEILRHILEGQFKEDAFENYLEAKDQLELIGTALDKRGAYKAILKGLNQAVTLEPSFALAYRELAHVHFTLGNDAEALKAYTKVMAADKAQAFDYTNAAYLYFRQDDLAKAREYYQRSLQLDSQQTNVQSYLKTVQKIMDGKISRQAYRFYDKGANASSPDSAEFYLRSAIAEDSAYTEAYLQLGLTQLRRGKQKQAESSFLKGLEHASEARVQGLFHYNLGLTYSQLDFHDKAITQFQKTLTLDSADFDALNNLSKVYADKSDLNDAVRTYDRLVRLDPEFFKPGREDLQSAGLDGATAALGDRSFYFDDSLTIGETHTYTLHVKSKKNALFGADANGDDSRELTITFREQAQDIAEYGVAEWALDILSVEGYAATAKEKNFAGQRFYLRMSDVFGLTNVYGLMESDPHSLPRFVIAVLEDLHGAFLRKRVSEGEIWRSSQYLFKLGSIEAVTELEDITDRTAYGKKYYGIIGSYDAAKYGEEGRVSLQNKGLAEFEFDISRHLMKKYSNTFTTRVFNESKASTELQEGGYEVTLNEVRYEKLAKPKKVVIENIPYVRQHGPQCAAASLSMVLSFYKQNIDQDEIYAAIKSDFAGAQSNDIIKYPRSLGKYKTFGYAGTLEDLKQRIDQHIPVLVFLTPFGYGHVVVVIGYDETKHQIIMHDPTVANNQAVSYDDFLQEWRQSGNECAIVVPFDQNIVVTEGPITSYKAVETKWQGDKALGDHNYDKAMNLFKESLQLTPKYEGALEGIMILYLQKDQFDKASAVLDTLLAWDPNSIDLVLKRASILLSQYDYDKVLQITKKAKQMDETNIVNYVYSAQALFSQKKYDEAIQEIKQAVKINPFVSTPRNLLSTFLAEVNDYDKAYEQANLAIKYEPENVANYIYLSSIYQSEITHRFLRGKKRLDLIKKSISATDVIKTTNPTLPNLDQLYADLYMTADMSVSADSLFYENIRKFPEENGAYNNLSWRYATDNVRLREAEQLSQKSIELSKRNPYYFDTLGWIHLKMAIEFSQANKKDSSEIYFRKAEAELKSTIEYDKYSDFAYRHLGVVYQKWGKLNEAKSQFDFVVEMMRDKERICVEIAQDCEEAGLYDAAMEFYSKALGHQPNLDYAAYRLAYLTARTKQDVNTALPLAQLALGLDSANFLYQGAVGIAYYLKKDLVQARSYLEQAVVNQQGYADKEAGVNNYYLGLVYRDLKKTENSKRQFAEYLKRAPNGEFAVAVKQWLK